jgi:hypothetical protein
MPNVNKEHLLKIKQHILEEPNRLDMSTWLQELDPGTWVFDTYAPKSTDQVVPSCGTVGCIAGWSSLLRGRKTVSTTFEMDFLRVSSNLFYPTRWPDTLQTAYEEATTPKEKAKITAKAIDLIIKGNGEFPTKEETE